MSATPNAVAYLSRQEALLRKAAFTQAHRAVPAITFEGERDWTFGASAEDKLADGVIIRLREGSCTILTDLFFRMVAHRRCFPNVGDRFKETITTPTLNDLYSDARRLCREGPNQSGEFAALSPNCNTRGLYAFFLMTVALDALVFHELGHVVHGHLGYLTAVASGAARAPSRLERKALEYDADVYAAQKCLQTVFFLRDRQLALRGRYFVPCLSKHEIVRDVAIAIHAMNIVYMENIRANEKQLNYPTFRIRQSAMALTLNTFMNEVVCDGVDYSGVIGGGVGSLEAAYALVTGREPEGSSLHESLRDSQTRQELERAWSTISPELEPYAYVKLPRARLLESAPERLR